MAFFQDKPLALARRFLAVLCLYVLCFCVLGGSLAARAEPKQEGAPPACAWLLGMTQTGSSGLFNLPLADPGCPWQLRLGVFGQGFVQYNFLLAGDRNEQMSGGVQIGATLGSYVETWLQIGSRSNRNQAPINAMSGSSQPTEALSRIALGLKLHSAWGRLWHVALQPTVRVNSGPFDFGPNFASIDGGIDLLGSLDLSAVFPRLPLRLSARAGYLYDRSSTLIAALDCMAQGDVQCLSTRLIYTTAYDIGQPRVNLDLGADARFYVGAGLSIGPMVSYSLAVVTGDGDRVLRTQLSMQAPAVSADDIGARVAQILTIGARLLLPWQVSIDLGMEVALSSWGYAMGPKLPQIAGYGALSFALDLSSGFGGGSAAKRAGGRLQEDINAAEKARTVALPADLRMALSQSGLIRGMVRDVKTKRPLADAVVRFIGVPQNALLTDEQGSYQSGLLPAGPLAIEASRGDHQTARVAVVVRPGETVAANLELDTTARAAPALLWVELLDELNAHPAAMATLSRQGSGQVVEMSQQPGGLLARLPGGSWRLRIDAVGYLSREQILVLPAGEERRISLRLVKRPQVPRVRLGADEILLTEPLSFAGDPLHPQLAPASTRLLDEVIDLLIHHLELRQVRIESAGPGNDTQLIVVRDYLVQGGTSPGRIIAVEAPGEGYYDRTPRILLRVVR